MKTKWMGLMAALCSAVAFAARAAGDEPPQLPLVPAAAISTQLALDVTDLRYGYPPTQPPMPFTVQRSQLALAGVLHDAASAPDGGAAVGAGLGFGWASSNSVSTPSLRMEGLYGNASAAFSCTDQIRIIPDDPSLMGQRGRFAAMLLMEGQGNAIESAGGDGAQTARASCIAGFTAAGMTVDQQSFVFGGQWDSLDGGGSQFAGEGFGLRTFLVDFVFGETLFINLGGSASTFAEDGNGQTASASAQLTLLQWMGMSHLVDSSGNAAGSYTVFSESGVDWSQPAAVPEPAVMALLLPVALLLQRKPAR